MSQAFIQIPLSDLDALERLSKNALKLYILLRKSLNRKTGQCNPTPESIGWERSKYYRARKELALVGIVDFEGNQAGFVVNRQMSEVENCQSGEMAKLQLENGETPTKKLAKLQLAYKEEPEEFNQRGEEPEARTPLTPPPFDFIETLPNQRTPFQSRLAEICGEVSTHWKVTDRLRQAERDLVAQNVTIADLNAFARQCQKTPALSWVVSDVGRWLKDKASAPKQGYDERFFYDPRKV